MSIKQLEAPGVALTFDSNRALWCKLSARIAGNTYALGSESYTLLLGRFLDGLKQRADWPTMPPEGMREPQWLRYPWKKLLTLPEGHTSLYVNRATALYHFVVEGKNGREV